MYRHFKIKGKILEKHIKQAVYPEMETNLVLNCSAIYTCRLF